MAAGRRRRCSTLCARCRQVSGRGGSNRTKMASVRCVVRAGRADVTHWCRQRVCRRRAVARPGEVRVECDERSHRDLEARACLLSRPALRLATPTRFERVTFPLGGGCSIQLSYGAVAISRCSRLLYDRAAPECSEPEDCTRGGRGPATTVSGGWAGTPHSRACALRYNARGRVRRRRLVPRGPGHGAPDRA